MSAPRRNNCRAPAGQPCASFGKRGLCRQCLTPEVRAKMSAARKKALADPEVRAKMSAARKKALADPEVRAKISAAIKKALADPEVRAKISAARKKALADPEVRAKMSAARKKAWADPSINPLAMLTAEERADYDLLKRAGYSRAEAFDALGKALP